MEINDLTYKIRGAIFDVYNEVGPGLLESYYEKALCYELKRKGLSVRTQVPVGDSYKGHPIEVGYRIDILVEDEVIIEVKSVEHLQDVHKKQLLTYLRLGHKRMGILINFNTAYIQDKVSLIRVIN